MTEPGQVTRAGGLDSRSTSRERPGMRGPREHQGSSGPGKGTRGVHTQLRTFRPWGQADRWAHPFAHCSISQAGQGHPLSRGRQPAEAQRQDLST